MSLYKDASLVMIPSAYKDGKLYSIRPIPEYGSELVTNGDFASDSDWTKGAGWTISGGSASCDGSQSGNSILYQNISHSANKKYRVEFTISGYVSGQVDFALDTPFFGTTSSNGTFVFDGNPPSGGNFIIRADADFVGSVDNVSVKEITNNGDFTFSRGSNLAATRVDVNGLIEKGRENRLIHSNDLFENVYVINGCSVVGNQADKDGGTDAFILIPDASPSSKYIYHSDYSSTNLNTGSVYVKYSGYHAQIRVYGIGGGRAYANFDLQNGTKGTSGGDSIVDSTITSVGNDWYRVTLTIQHSGSYNVGIGPIPSPTSSEHINYAGDGTSGIFLQDFQLEQGLVATDYIETGVSTAQAGILEDMPRLDYSGGASCPSLLLEPQRSQLITQSEYFGDTQWPVDGVSLDANNATSPEGLQNAYKITDDTSTGYHKITKTNVFAAGGTMRTWSVFVKKGNARYCVISHAEIFSSYVNSLIFDMQEGVYTNEGTTNYFDIVQEPIDMGNGWWRIGFSSDLNSSSYDNFSIGISRGADWLNNASYTGDGSLNFYIYGAQVEVGSYPTSYIPTYGSSVTRSQDVCEDAGDAATFNSTEGVLYAEIAALADDLTFRGVSLSDGTYNNRCVLRYGGASNRINVLVSSAGSIVFDNNFILSNIKDFSKIAIKWKANDFALWVNGSEVATDTSGASPTGLSQFQFADSINSSVFFYGKTKQVLYFPTALTDSECIALTTL